MILETDSAYLKSTASLRRIIYEPIGQIEV
jgi:hypothetical protein